MSWLAPIRFALNLIQSQWILISCILFAAIAVLSLTPLPELPPQAGSDKTHHFIAYGALMFPTALRRPRRWWLIALLFVALSGIIELVQPLASRHMEAADLLANSIGILCGAGVAHLLQPLCYKPESGQVEASSK